MECVAMELRPRSKNPSRYLQSLSSCESLPRTSSHTQVRCQEHWVQEDLQLRQESLRELLDQGRAFHDHLQTLVQRLLLASAPAPVAAPAIALPPIPAPAPQGMQRPPLPQCWETAAPAACVGRTTPPGTCSSTCDLSRTTTTQQGYREQHLQALRAQTWIMEQQVQDDRAFQQELLAQGRAICHHLQALVQSMLPRASPAPAAPQLLFLLPLLTPHLFLLNLHTLLLNLHTPYLNLRTLLPIPPGMPRPPPPWCWEAVGPVRFPPLSTELPLPLPPIASPFQLPPPSFPPPLSHLLSCPLLPPFPISPEVHPPVVLNKDSFYF
ncbi:uncharacterized protein LOC142828014 [Pelodiscus sinensis]|uniref:uncharacterized protein LOC142828014 n=1 Tax=Pelodiscus sinensis TaxID=13735 RepID=UPI003F6B54E8